MTSDLTKAIWTTVFPPSWQGNVPPGIMLTFDDCFIDEWYELLPLFKNYDTKATFFVSKPWSMDDKQLVKLAEISHAGHEIGVH